MITIVIFIPSSKHQHHEHISQFAARKTVVDFMRRLLSTFERPPFPREIMRQFPERDYFRTRDHGTISINDRIRDGKIQIAPDYLSKHSTPHLLNTSKHQSS